MQTKANLKPVGERSLLFSMLDLSSDAESNPADPASDNSNEVFGDSDPVILNRSKNKPKSNKIQDIFPDQKVRSKRDAATIDRFEEQAEAIVNFKSKSPIQESLGTMKEGKGKGHYQIDIQKLAILFCDVCRHSDGPHQDEPNYARVGGIMGIHPELIRQWWARREDINQLATNLGRFMDDFVGLKMNIVMIKMMDALENRDFDQFTDKDFVSMFNVMYNKWRLQSNKSTENVNHRHLVGLVPPSRE